MNCTSTSTRSGFDPADFAEWDEGKLSTNKAYQRIKAMQKKAEEERLRAEDALRNAERQRILAERERDAAHEALEDAYQTNEMLEDENARLRNQPKPEPQVIEKEVIKEVKPDDYDELKKRVADLSYEANRLNNKYQEALDEKRESDRKLAQANDLLGETKRTREANRDIEQLTSATNGYLRQYGGHAWVVDQLDRIDNTTLMEFRKAIASVGAFAQNLLAVIDDREGDMT